MMDPKIEAAKSPTNNAAKYNNIKAIHQENGGLSAARNTGIEARRKNTLLLLIP